MFQTLESDQFTGKMFRRLWVPAVISAVGWAIGDAADSIVVGQKMGEVGLASIALILPIYMVSSMAAHAFGAGGSARYARLLGSSKVNQAVKCFNETLIGTLALSIALTVLGNIFIVPLLKLLGTVRTDGELYYAAYVYLKIFLYTAPLFFLSIVLNYFLRNDDNEKIAGAGSMIGNICDVTCNVLLVIGLGMGTAGAGWATLVGCVISIAIYLPGIFGKAHILQIRKIDFSIKETAVIFMEGAASSSSYLCTLVFLILCNNILMDKIGPSGIAVLDIIQAVSYLILYVFDAASRAAAPLVSVYTGERNRNGRENSIRCCYLYGCLSGWTLIVFISIFPSALCSLFGLSGATAVMAQSALRIFCVGAVFAGMSAMAISVCQAAGNDKETFLITALRGAAVLLPVTFFFASQPFQYFWYLFPVTEMIVFIIWISSFLLHRKNRQTDEDRVMTRTIMNKNDDISVLTSEAKVFCEKWNADAKQTNYVTLSIEELCLAIMQNGFSADHGYINITLISDEDGSFELHLRDDAEQFNPFELKTEKSFTTVDEVDMDVIGIKFVKSRAKYFFYRQYGGFNSLSVKI
ncbi:MAG: multidrug transporter [Erysipelotrichia bacterium]|nr:multidrug transporter [Erysipelotrichia bacterium]